jgi:hypothetical protein
MRLTLWAAGLCAGVIAVMAYAAPPAEAAQKKKSVSTYSRSQVVASRPRTRITVQRRSFLDGGTEVLPGERKFMDYAFPPGEQGAPLSVVENTAFDRRSSLPGPFYLPSRQNPWPWNWCVGC